jgi:hypothetical protein
VFLSVLPAYAQQNAPVELLPTRMQGKWGCIDKSGKMIIPAEYEFVSYFRAGKAIAQKGKFLGVIDKTNKVLLPFEHLNLDTLTNECFATRNSAGKWGVIKITGETIVPTAFDRVLAQKLYDNTNLEAVFFQVKKGEFWGAYNTAGKEISPAIFEKYSFQSKDLIVREKDGLKGLVTLEGQEILPTEYEQFQTFPYNATYFYTRKQKMWGLAHESGKIAIPCEYDYIKTWGQEGSTTVIRSAANTFLEVSKAGKKGLYSLDFKILVPCEYDFIEKQDAYPNYYVVSKMGNNGLFDRRSMTLVLDCIYTHIFLQSDEIAIVRQTKDYVSISGVLNFMKKKEIVPIQYNIVEALEGGGRKYFLATQLKNYTIYNQIGQILLKNEPLDEVEFDNMGIFQIQSNGKWGVFNEFGTIKPVFESISHFKRNLALVRLNNLSGLVNIRAQIVIPVAYKHIKMSGQTARLSNPNGGTEVIIFDAQGNIIDRVTYQTQLKTIGIKKDKNVKEEGETWEFEMEERRVMERRSNNSAPAVVDLRRLGIPQRSTTSFTIDNLTFGYYASLARWYALRQGGDTLLKPLYVYVKEIPELHLVQIAQIKEETEGDDKGKFFAHWGLLDSQTGKWIFALSKEALGKTQGLIEDFRRGSVGRLPMSFLRRDGFLISSLKMTEKGKNVVKNIFYCEPYDTLTHLAQFNSGGFIIDKKSLLNKANLKGGLWGLMSREGAVATLPTYQDIRQRSKLYFVKNGRYGALDSTGKEIIPCKFSRIAYLQNTQKKEMTDFVLLATHVERFGFLDSSRTVIIDAQFKKALPFKEGFAPVMQDSLSLWTFIDKQGNVLHPFQFREVRHFSEGLAAVKIGQKWGYLNNKGQIVIEPTYSQAQDFQEGKALVREVLTGKLLYIDTHNMPVGSLRFEKAYPFSKGVAVAQDIEKHLFGLLNEKGEWFLPARYVEITPFNEQGYAFYKTELGNRIGLLDRQGREITKPKYTKIEPFENGLAQVADGSDWNFIDSTGNTLLKNSYKELHHFEGNLCLAKTDEGYGYLNRKGEWQILPTFERASHFENFVAEVTPKNARKSIYIDTTGKEVSKPKDWLTLGDFAEYEADSLLPIARILYNGRWGYWDRVRQKIFIFPFYRKASAFYNGYAKIEDLRGNIRYISLRKETLPALPNKVLWYDSEHDNYKTIRENGLYGFATLHDFVYSEPKFSKVGELQENRVPVVVPTLYGVADRRGNILLEPVYERIIYAGEDIFRVEINDKIGYWHKTKGWLWEVQK